MWGPVGALVLISVARPSPGDFWGGAWERVVSDQEVMSEVLNDHIGLPKSH